VSIFFRSMKAYIQQPIRWIQEKGTLGKVNAKTKRSTTMQEESQLQKVEKVTNPDFFRAIGCAPFQSIDTDRQGYIELHEFKTYFCNVANDEEAEHAFKLLNPKGDGQLTYGEFHSFQQAFEEQELLGNFVGSNKVGCPDFLDYASMLLGMKLSLTRKHFLARLKATGQQMPVSDEWLEGQMKREWTAHPNFAKHWEYVIEVCPMEEKERRFPDWAGGFSIRDAGHEGMSVDDFCAVPLARDAGLGRPDVLGLRLYTGPGYLPLNGSLRAHTHRFPVTQFCIDRAVGRLSQVGNVKQLFRGLRKKMHPRWSRLYEVYRGAGHHKLALVDCAFVSTTLDTEVAAGPTFGGPVVFQLRTRDPVRNEGTGMGFICDGGSIGWASQYPEEAEVLLPSNTILVPQLRCKHMERREPSIPKGRDVYMFHPFYPWDFSTNMPLMADEYYTAANSLLEAVHDLDASVLNWCKNKHSEVLNPNPPLPPVPPPSHHKDRRASIPPPAPPREPVEKTDKESCALETDRSCASSTLPSASRCGASCPHHTIENCGGDSIFEQDAFPEAPPSTPRSPSRSVTPLPVARPLWNTAVMSSAVDDSALQWSDSVLGTVVCPSRFMFPIPSQPGDSLQLDYEFVPADAPSPSHRIRPMVSAVLHSERP